MENNIIEMEIDSDGNYVVSKSKVSRKKRVNIHKEFKSVLNVCKKSYNFIFKFEDIFNQWLNNL